MVILSQFCFFSRAVLEAQSEDINKRGQTEGNKSYSTERTWRDRDEKTVLQERGGEEKK